MFACRQLTLTHFRNYSFQRFDFTHNIVGIFGRNGSGKTNLLDAVYYLCFTKSSFSRPDVQSVKNGCAGFRIEGTFQKDDGSEKLVCILRENGRKEFSINETSYQRFSDHIGKFPCVMIAPDDVTLITEGSEERRKFIDTLLSQLQHDYLEQLIGYNKVLQQRNSFLKFASERNDWDESLLDILNKQLIEKGDFIHRRRLTFLNIFLPAVLQQYISIASHDDMLALKYDSQLMNVAFEELLQQNFQRYLYLQRTGCGIHKDDLDIRLNETPFKNVASQGQRKSLLFAMKLAAFETLKENKGFPPILLLDDVFEKLDEERMHNLLEYVCLNTSAQVFITDTHEERLQQAFMKIGKDFQLIGL